MALTVHVPEWHLDEDDTIVTVGDHLSMWLEFHEAGRWEGRPEALQQVRGVARPIPPWPGAEHGRHPTVVEVGDATLYWDAPEPVSGPIDVTGVIADNNVDAPPGFAATNGVVSRVRMEWRDYRLGDGNTWYPVPGTTGYEEVAASYLSAHEAPDATASVGAVRRLWTGVLLELDVRPPPGAEGTVAPTSHRRDGKAKVAGPPPTFREELNMNSRTFAMVAVGGLGGVVWGLTMLRDGGTPWWWAVGLLAVALGVLIWVSYILRFLPGWIAGERWTRTRTRRTLRAVIKYAWVAFLAAVFVGALARLIVA